MKSCDFSESSLLLQTIVKGNRHLRHAVYLLKYIFSPPRPQEKDIHIEARQLLYRLAMKIVGKLTARTLVYFGAVEMTFVILLCYALAVSHHHVKPWLPTISACGEHPPEQYPFRFGIMIGAMMLFVEAIALYAASITSSVTHILGMIASLCLGVVAVVAANEDDAVHTSK